MACSVASSLTSRSPIGRHIIISNMPPTNNNNDRIPASIRDELRRAVALYCLDIVFQRDSMKVAQMRKLMFDLYHGNDKMRIISHVQLLCDGKEMFEDFVLDVEYHILRCVRCTSGLVHGEPLTK